MSEQLNLRYELRAYEDPDACRLASILREAMSRRTTTVMRDEVAPVWAKRYPRHAAQTGRRNIHSRVSRALSLMRTAQIVQTPDPDTITIVDAQRLGLAASNLLIIEDNEGMPIRPGLWSSRPVVPPHLLPAQDLLEQTRSEADKQGA